jgi:hypothetical protein
MSETFAAHYTSTLPPSEGHHVYEPAVISAVNNYLDNNWWQVIDENELTDVVAQAIISIWWWWVSTVSQLSAITYENVVTIELNILTVWCWNTDFWYFLLDEPASPPPPDPVTTTWTSSSSWWSCSSYISSWSEVWWNCNISSDWTTSWQINCTQTSSWNSNYSSCWATITTTDTTYTDWVVTGTSSSSYCDSSSCPWNAPSPANRTDTIIISADLNSVNSYCDWALYADNSDSCELTLNISWMTNQWQPIIGLSWKDVIDIKDKSNYSSNQIDGIYNETNSSALNFDWVTSSTINWSWTNYSVNIAWIKSRTPLNRNDWKIELQIQWLSNYTTINLNNINYNFKKPFIWKISASNDLWITWTWESTLWTEILYKLWLEDVWGLNWSSLNNYYLDNFETEINPLWTWLEIQSVSLSWTTLNSKEGTLFEARINTSIDATELSNPWIQIDLPKINYNLEWHNVKYYLSNTEEGNDMTPVQFDWEDFVWVKIIWTLQWDWKSEFTWQEENFSDLSTSELRNTIRQNAYLLTKNMTDGQIINWVKYVVWDYNISWENLWFETLVVINWNINITWSLNTNGDKLWIIVLSDWYNIISDYSNKWNVYIDKDATYINATIYADWGLISSNNGMPYITDTYTRTVDLQNQLIIKWSIFTRNTIWWAILAWWSYLLPWWQTTSSFNNAMIYDLNYLRRWNLLNDGTYLDYTIIEYNPEIQTNPPIWFSK